MINGNKKHILINYKSVYFLNNFISLGLTNLQAQFAISFALRYNTKK